MTRSKHSQDWQWIKDDGTIVIKHRTEPYACRVVKAVRHGYVNFKAMLGWKMDVRMIPPAVLEEAVLLLYPELAPPKEEPPRIEGTHTVQGLIDALMKIEDKSLPMQMYPTDFVACDIVSVSTEDFQRNPATPAIKVVMLWDVQ